MSENVPPTLHSERNRVTKVKEKKIAAVKPRNPLSDLCENQPQTRGVTLHQKITIKINIKKKATLVAENKIEQTETNYYFKSENVTERQQQDEVEDDLDEVFVDGDQHYLNYIDSNQKEQGAKSNAGVGEDVDLARILPVVRKNSIKNGSKNQEIQNPAQKVTLVRRLRRRKRHFTLTQLHKDCLYDEEYFQDNIEYIRKRELHYVYRLSYLKKNSSKSYRMNVVHWLIYVGEILDTNEHTFFIAVRIFDYILANNNLPTNQYILFAICCLWIANKTVDVHHIMASKLFSICNGKFSRHQILAVERNILKAIKYDTNVPEPMPFLFYILKRESLEEELKIVCSVTFILEAFALLLEFSSLAPSMLACCALYQVFQKYDIESESFLNFVQHHVLEKTIFLKKSEHLRLQINEVFKSKTASGNLIEKYSTEEKCFVARDFIAL